MNKRIRSISINSIVQAAFIIWFISDFLSKIAFKDDTLKVIISSIDKSINIIVLLLLIAVIFLLRYSCSQLVMIAIVSILIITSAILSGYNSLLSAWLFIIASKNVDFKALVKRVYYLTVVLIPFVLLSSILGITNNIQFYRFPSMKLRSSMGFDHPNTLGQRIFQLWMFIVFLKNGSLKVYDYIFLLLSIAFVAYIPNSQAAYMSLLIVLAIVSIYGLMKKHTNNGGGFLCNACIYSTAIIVVLSLILSLIDLKKYHFLYLFDTIMGKRFSVCYRDYQLFGISIWGQKVYTTLEERKIAGINEVLFLDNAYMAILLRFGIVVFAIFICAYINNMIYQKNKNSIITIIFFLYAIYGVFENGIYIASYNVFLITMTSFLFNNADQKKFKVLFTSIRH